MRRFAAALAVGLLALALYLSTLLPGVDFGDTGSFQLMAGSPFISPRDGYPLYFAIGDLLKFATGLDGARALNMASAIEGSVACALLVIVAAEFSGSSLAGVAAALFFAGSYTFWSQSIIAEVYALHLTFVVLTLILLLRWEARPTLGRLAAFFGAYAIGFGNHLSMILLAPAYVVFLMTSARGGWREMLSVRVIALASALAAAGSLQYLWNLRSLWLAATPPPTLIDALGRFWFDVTKTDWRETMLLQLPRSMAAERLRMYGFDLLQQFGWSAPVLALCGAVDVTRTTPRRGALLLLLYLVNVAFAFSYNVGDSHVFFLPSHLVLAILMGCGVSALQRAAELLVAPVTGVSAESFTTGWGLLRPTRPSLVMGALFIVLAMFRGWRDYPALDRSGDHRPTEVVSALGHGLADRSAILLVDVNWQVENGLRYFAKRVRRDLAWARMNDVLLYLPALVRDNLAVGRQVALTERARTDLVRAYGPLVESVRDEPTAAPKLAEVVRSVARGTPYVLCVLRPSSEFPLDAADLAEALEGLTGKRVSHLQSADYAAIAGLAGEPPVFVSSANRPFRSRVRLADVPVDIRMESWLEFDTIRRMGFGQVVAGRRHALIVERGISFVAFDEHGRTLASVYAANLFAPQPRYLVRALHLPSVER